MILCMSIASADALELYRRPRRDLTHMGSPERRLDFAELSRRIGWVTWEEICEVVTGSPVFRAPEFPREGFERFFRERCLWPDGGSRPLVGGVR